MMQQSSGHHAGNATRAPGQIEIISATRRSGQDAQHTPLGQSITRLYNTMGVTLSLYLENRAGLPEVYNREIDDGPDDSILVFVHDDVWIEDLFLDYTLAAAMSSFDVIGVAGNRRRQARQETWALQAVEPRMVADSKFLSGRLGQGKGPTGPVVNLGPVGVACQLLDGVFLAARRGVLKRSGVRFDPRFRFHFYDLDFCRSATRAGLRIGTWPVSITHESAGQLDDVWRAARDVYLAKWPD